MDILNDTINFIRENHEWIFGGVGASLLSWLGYTLNPFKNKNDSKDEAPNTNTNTNTINVNVPGIQEQEKKTANKTCKHTPDERKKLTKILFIDDETFQVVSILKKSGWVNTKRKQKVTGPDDPSIQEADICFVDIYGVATELYEKDQGLGLVGAIKDRHPEKKVVVYSSQEQGDVFNELWDKADGRLSKNAEPYQFENLLENFSEEIYC